MQQRLQEFREEMEKRRRLRYLLLREQSNLRSVGLSVLVVLVLVLVTFGIVQMKFLFQETTDGAGRASQAQEVQEPQRDP